MRTSRPKWISMKGNLRFHYSLSKIVLTVFLLSSSCCRPKMYEKTVDVPEKTLETRVDSYLQTNAFTPSEKLPEDWWLIFQDEQLNALIQQGLGFHPSIEKAASVARQAYAQAQGKGAALLPTLDFNTDVMRYHVSKTSLFGLLAQSPALSSFPFNYTQSEFYLNFNFEIDWWGKNRDAFIAALDVVQARIAEEAIARLTLSTNIADAYIHLQASIKRESLAAKYVGNRAEVLDLIKKRVAHNLDDSIRIHDFEQLLFQAQEQLEYMRQSRLFYEDTLRSYISANVDEHFDPSSILDNIAALPLPENLPLDLLSRRPDITAQIWRIEAAFRQVKVACKEFYPNLNLMGIWGHQTLLYRTLFEDRSAYAQYGPAINLPLFRGGALRANLADRDADLLTAILDYEQMVLNTVRDVFTGLSAVDAWHKRIKYLTDNVNSASSEYDLNAKRLEFNLASQIDLLESERVLLGAFDALAVDQEGYLLAQLSLINTLGGGYLAPGYRCD